MASAGLLLAGCEGQVTSDLATDAPADPAISRVEASLVGIEFERSGGGTQALQFSASEPLDLTDYPNGSPLRLFTNETLPDGHYTGVRLVFDADADAQVVMNDGEVIALSLEQGEYADVDFEIEDSSDLSSGSNESIVLTLDLRQSLDTRDEDEYVLEPVVRAVDASDAAFIEGALDVTCVSGTLSVAAAVYLFEGHDVTPDDIDGEDAEPVATARAVTTAGGFAYALGHLPAGDYTIALTCEGEDEVLATDDDLAFQDAANLELDAREELTHDFSD